MWFGDEPKESVTLHLAVAGLQPPGSHLSVSISELLAHYFSKLLLCLSLSFRPLKNHTPTFLHHYKSSSLCHFLSSSSPFSINLSSDSPCVFVEERTLSLLPASVFRHVQLVTCSFSVSGMNGPSSWAELRDGIGRACESKVRMCLVAFCNVFVTKVRGRDVWPNREFMSSEQRAVSDVQL